MNSAPPKKITQVKDWYSVIYCEKGKFRQSLLLIAKRYFTNAVEAEIACDQVMNSIERDNFARLHTYNPKSCPLKFIYRVFNNALLDVFRAKYGRYNIPKAFKTQPELHQRIHNALFFRDTRRTQLIEELMLEGVQQSVIEQAIEDVTRLHFNATYNKKKPLKLYRADMSYSEELSTTANTCSINHEATDEIHMWLQTNNIDSLCEIKHLLAEIDKTVLVYVLQGKPVSEIARKLDISRSKVKTALRDALWVMSTYFKKLEVDYSELDIALSFITSVETLLALDDFSCNEPSKKAA